MSFLRRSARGFNSDLHQLVLLVAEMGKFAERQLAQAIEALTRRDNEQARANVAADATIDVMQQAIEQRAMKIILRRRPPVEDLRQLVGIVRIAGELERIGDLAKNISKRIIAISDQDIPSRPLRGFIQMASLMMTLLRDVLDSFARRDVAKAIDVWARDFDIDRLCVSLFRDFLAYMTENPLAITLGVHLMFCVKNLERMGDHATNMAEAIHYMVMGHALARERPKADVVSGLSIAAQGANHEMSEDWLAPAAVPSAS
jgi:phosphate transport system protein